MTVGDLLLVLLGMNNGNSFFSGWEGEFRVLMEYRQQALQGTAVRFSVLASVWTCKRRTHTLSSETYWQEEEKNVHWPPVLGPLPHLRNERGWALPVFLPGSELPQGQCFTNTPCAHEPLGALLTCTFQPRRSVQGFWSCTSNRLQVLRLVQGSQSFEYCGSGGTWEICGWLRVATTTGWSPWHCWMGARHASHGSLWECH